MERSSTADRIWKLSGELMKVFTMTGVTTGKSSYLKLIREYSRKQLNFLQDSLKKIVGI